jgi:hypothetical protein
MTCVKCGYVLGDGDATCPRCGADPGQPGAHSPEVIQRVAWEQETVAYVAAHAKTSPEAAREALAACNWDASNAFAALGAPVPVARAAARPGGGAPSVALIVGLIILIGSVLCIAPMALIVGLGVRNAGQRAKSARKMEDVRSINNASTIYENDTGRVPQKVEELEAPTGPKGYSGPYLAGERPMDPFGGGAYQLRDGQVVGPADVTTFQG